MHLPFPKSTTLLMVLSCPFFLTGCADIARGVTEAVIEDSSKQEDTRLCEIEGGAFSGIRHSLDSQSTATPKVTKILMVHGISNHLPGYSSSFQKMLYQKLGLSLSDSTIKNITLDSEDLHVNNKAPTLGSLRISRHWNDDNTRQLIFYELTWSPITAPQKQTLESDSANNEGLSRADLNGSIKSFINMTVPDLLVYTGNGYKRITTAVAQSVCWMIADDWDNLPENGTHECNKRAPSSFASLKADDHFFVTHSLGSRITIDTIQNFSALNRKTPEDARRQEVGRIIRDKEFTVFMMANQLPLLQVGRDAPAITGANKTYCDPLGAKEPERVMRKMNIIAFSDPNDILSYPVPLDFERTWIDSRICPSIVNISMNIAEQKSFFSAATFANPLTAHTGYMEDDRVIDLIANGMNHNNVTPLIAKRCKWFETREMGKKE